MQITNSNRNRVINSMDDWKKCVTDSKWAVGRSAHALADFVLNKNGMEKIQHRISHAIGNSVIFNRAMVEYEIRFDNLGKGRVHDLGIYGKTDGGEKLLIKITK